MLSFFHPFFLSLFLSALTIHLIKQPMLRLSWKFSERSVTLKYFGDIRATFVVYFVHDSTASLSLGLLLVEALR